MPLVLFLLCLLISPWTFAQSGDIALEGQTPMISLEGKMAYFFDAKNQLPFEAVQQQDFHRLKTDKSLGYNMGAHWFHLRLTPMPDAPERWVLAIGSPELAEVDVWLEQSSGQFIHYALGYQRPYQNRLIQTRLFALPFNVFAGQNVYFRVHTTNAIIVDANLWQVNAFTSHESRSDFYRGGYFGILLTAMLLYVILGLRLKDTVMCAYAAYIGSQILFHLGTNGYLPVLLTWQSAWLSDALPRIGWLGAAASMVLMWDKLLQLKKNAPMIHYLFVFTLLLNLALLPFALMPSWVNVWVLVVVKFANLLNSFNIFISLLLLLWFWQRHKHSQYFIYFAAFIIPAIGLSINSLANLGHLPQNLFTHYFYQVATLVHVLVMSYGLALRLNRFQQDKVKAEQEAAATSQRAADQRRFVAMLSHEFRNPLAVIDRTTQMLQLKLPDLPASESKRLSQIRSNSAALFNLVDNFLITETLDHGRLPLAARQQGIAAFLSQVIEALGDEGKRVQLHLNLTQETALFDKHLMSMALSNIVLNALKYSPPDSPVVIDVQNEAKDWLITVSDQGPGLSQEELALLGTPYFRADAALGKKGSGLGYHFSQRILSAHGGSLSAKSLASGLAVTLRLPAA